MVFVLQSGIFRNLDKISVQKPFKKPLGEIACLSKMQKVSWLLLDVLAQFAESNPQEPIKTSKQWHCDHRGRIKVWKEIKFDRCALNLRARPRSRQLLGSAVAQVGPQHLKNAEFHWSKGFHVTKSDESCTYDSCYNLLQRLLTDADSKLQRVITVADSKLQSVITDYSCTYDSILQREWWQHTYNSMLQRVMTVALHIQALIPSSQAREYLVSSL